MLPPEAFVAIAQFRLGVWLATDGKLADAVSTFSAVRERFPDARGESGLPLGPLAELKALELSVRMDRSTAAIANVLASFCSNIVNQPSFLSPHLLAKAAEVEASVGVRNVVEPWRREWERQEALRVLSGGGAQGLDDPGLGIS